MPPFRFKRFLLSVRHFLLNNIPILLVALLLIFIVRELLSLRKQLSSMGSEQQKQPNEDLPAFAPGKNTGCERPPLPRLAPILEAKASPPAVQPPAQALSTARPAGTNKRLSGRQRALMLLSIGILAVLIGTAFFYSMNTYTTIITSLGQVRADQLIQSDATSKKPATAFPQYERGIIYPRWQTNGYGSTDTVWQLGIETVKTQTSSQWTEIPVLFSQSASVSTDVQPSQSAPTLQSFKEGIQRAHSLGYKVFFVPLMQVRQSGGWSGSITFNNAPENQAWFDSYWQAMQPYIKVAASEHVEQMAIGTELQTLQKSAPDRYWNQLIQRIQTVFTNKLTYDMNWSSLSATFPTWLSNPALNYIGVSAYVPLVDTPIRVDPNAMSALWETKIKTQLDDLSVQFNKPVLISEIGYRNSADALYQTWEITSKALPDPEEQAGAYDATLSNAMSDPHIAGTFFWGWDDVGMFSIKNQPATQILLKWYTLAHS